jgi:hypothetical protein
MRATRNRKNGSRKHEKKESTEKANEKSGMDSILLKPGMWTGFLGSF